MFDTIRIGGDSHHRHEITERKAPTDESVRLLREMEAAAEKNVLCRGKLESNILQDIKWVVVHQPYEDKILGMVRFSLNGREFVMDIDFPCAMAIRYMGPPKEFIQKVHETVIRKMAETITVDFCDKEAESLYKTIQ
jgi:hypothetical protein